MSLAHQFLLLAQHPPEKGKGERLGLTVPASGLHRFLLLGIGPGEQGLLPFGGFVAVLANQSRNQGWKVAQFDPARRASRFFRHEDRLHSVRPDAFGVLKRNGKVSPFFLEWERRAVRPTTMAARSSPYLRYYAANRPLDDHGAVPAVLVVFDDDIAASHFLRVAEDEMKRAGVTVPLWVSHKAALERLGPLGAAWQKPGSWKPPQSFR